jgi:hypothetical protein
VNYEKQLPDSLSESLTTLKQGRHPYDGLQKRWRCQATLKLTPLTTLKLTPSYTPD